jgi:hypothetical protein
MGTGSPVQTLGIYAQEVPCLEFDADFMVSLPDHPALPTRLRSSCQMQRKLLREIINVHDRQTRTYFRQVDERAPLENVARRSFDPSRLEHSSKEPAPIEKVRVHLVPASATRGRRFNDLSVLSIVPVGNRLCAASDKPVRSAKTGLEWITK